MTSEEQFSAAEISWRWDGKDFISNRIRTGSIKLIFYWGGTLRKRVARRVGGYGSRRWGAHSRGRFQLSKKAKPAVPGGALALMI